MHSISFYICVVLSACCMNYVCTIGNDMAENDSKDIRNKTVPTVEPLEVNVIGKGENGQNRSGSNSGYSLLQTMPLTGKTRLQNKEGDSYKRTKMHDIENKIIIEDGRIDDNNISLANAVDNDQTVGDENADKKRTEHLDDDNDNEEEDRYYSDNSDSDVNDIEYMTGDNVGVAEADERQNKPDADMDQYVDDTDYENVENDVENGNRRKAKHIKDFYFVSETRALKVVRTFGDTLNGCVIFNERLPEQTNEGLVQINISESSMDEMASLCATAATLSTNKRKKRFIDTIYPGTKWCGIGNVATHDSDLGELDELDACCRTHDNCRPEIPPFENKFGLFNFAIWTKKHCDCDSAFFTCLKNVGTEDSDYIGNVFFNVVSVGCIDKVWQKKCTRRNWLGICNRWKNDKSKRKVYTFVDNTLDY